MLAAVQSTLLFLTSMLATALQLVFEFPLISGGNFLKLLVIVGTFPSSCWFFECSIKGVTF
jgi:hypothetical protein